VSSILWRQTERRQIAVRLIAEAEDPRKGVHRAEPIDGHRLAPVDTGHPSTAVSLLLIHCVQPRAYARGLGRLLNGA
jgi:hypothetical protein